MEALLGVAWRQSFCHAALHRETGRIPAVKAPVLPLSGRERFQRGSLVSLQASASDSEIETLDVSGSLVQQALRHRVEPFSRPTQLLSSQEVRIVTLSEDLSVSGVGRIRLTWIAFHSQVIDALYAGVHSNAISNYMAFYSSELGGIVTDPALMVVSVDDHMVHRGHAVFDTATLTQGYLYQLDDHLDRFYRSASKAALTPPFSRNQIRRIILDTAAATKSFEGRLGFYNTKLLLPDMLSGHIVSLMLVKAACQGG